MHTQATPRIPPAAPRARPGVPWAAALAVDVAGVLLFAAVGRRTHALGVAGVLETAWPFLVGLLVGWIAWRVHRAPVSVWPRGVALWLTTVLVGMVLRVLTGDGTAPSFVLVTFGVLAVLLLGSRALRRLLRAVRSRRTT